ncbi:MAG: DoxX family protein [Verrucomicrobiota bacterium]
MRLQFLAKYREAGLLLLRISLGLLFIYLTAPALLGGSTRLAHFGAGIRILGLHSHFQLWGMIGALAGCLGGALMIFGLFFRIGVLLVLAITLVHVAVAKGALGFHGAIPAVETAIVLVSLLFIGPGKYSVDKT